MAEILVKGKPWHYEATSYYDSERVLNHKDAEYIILTTKQILDQHGIKFMPMFGTLLGIIRQGYFIPKDEDMDLMIHEKDRQSLIDLIPEFHEKGIEFSRCSEPWVYTFRYKSADCDFYAIQDAGWLYRWHYVKVLKQYMPNYFEKTQKQEFLGQQFDVPENPIRVLEYCYGKDWRIPQSKSARVQAPELIHIVVYRFILRVMSYVKRHFLS